MHSDLIALRKLRTSYDALTRDHLNLTARFKHVNEDKRELKQQVYDLTLEKKHLTASLQTSAKRLANSPSSPSSPNNPNNPRGSPHTPPGRESIANNASHAAKTQIEELTKQVKLLVIRNNMLHADNDVLTSQKDGLEAQYNSIHTKYQDVVSRFHIHSHASSGHVQTQAQYSELKTSHQDLASKHEGLTRQYVQVINERDDLTVQCTQLKQQLTDSHTKRDHDLKRVLSGLHHQPYIISTLNNTLPITLLMYTLCI